MKKFVMAAIVGMGFGFPITLLCMTLIGGYNEVVRELLIWMGASALYGLLSVAMESKKLDMPLPLSGYISRIVDVLLVLAPTVVIYIAVCLICFLLMKKDEKQINKALQEK